MSAETESIASLMARRDYQRAIPLLRRDLEKYPSNVRIRLQLADALSGSGAVDEALERYEQTAEYYEENGLIVQAIAVRKKADKLRETQPRPEAVPQPPPPPPVTARPPPAPPAVTSSPLFTDLTAEERKALVDEMELEQFDEGDIVITEGEQGCSLYVIAAGEVKIYTRGPKGESVFLAKLTEGDFFGEVSVLTGKPRTATITASKPSELLRLDKDKLDRLVAGRPRIRQILDEFYRRRASQTVEAMIETLKQRGRG
ncbi:MAG TPA: cyclic nucleotide-binding domain-containing protein [Thermoanaerobaculia bacterium]|nr:cyclic nucleotide-binding domain-containing protein [Thermoanaerobaculia bacterium]